MGVRASFYETFALAMAGMPAVTADLRGQGASSERAARGARFGYREIVELDLPAAVAAVEGRFFRRAVLLSSTLSSTAGTSPSGNPAPVLR